MFLRPRLAHQNKPFQARDRTTYLAANLEHTWEVPPRISKQWREHSHIDATFYCMKLLFEHFGHPAFRQLSPIESGREARPRYWPY